MSSFRLACLFRIRDKLTFYGFLMAVSLMKTGFMLGTSVFQFAPTVVATLMKNVHLFVA